MIASPEEKEGEIDKVRAYFDMGLNCFHLRKPGWSIAEYEDYVSQFSVLHRKKIHVHALMPSKKELGGIHLSEALWRDLSESDWKVLRKEADQNEQKLSVSLHSLKDVENALKYSDYAFLSPVYDSISKPGYFASERIWEEVKSKTKNTTIIALGGVRIENYEALKKAGFDGVALLGAFWEAASSKENLESFWNKATQIFAT